ncbi:ferritin-like domain-containing protein [Magnetovibrio sp.]|uniref:ferritin-like domain-containing protein n=1 Tax=Magnetovibrio sp. TaxID=2024836 RepID=UPI002F93BE72
MAVTTLTEAALAVLNAAAPADKVRLTYDFAQMWRDGDIAAVGDTQPPERPARPAKPELCSPGDMPKRSAGGGKRRVNLIHAIAHIELNAIDLAWDVVARFTHEDLPKGFFDDWVQVAEDEARHFEMLEQRLGELDAHYGDLPAHDGLWEAAVNTADDILARLSLVPMVLEARGLDTTPASVERLRANGDDATAAIMQQIGDEEIAHVAAGVRWFEHVCAARGLDPVPTFQALVAKHFKGRLKPPFNTAARTQAGMGHHYYAFD